MWFDLNAVYLSTDSFATHSRILLIGNGKMCKQDDDDDDDDDGWNFCGLCNFRICRSKTRLKFELNVNISLVVSSFIFFKIKFK